MRASFLILLISLAVATATAQRRAAAAVVDDTIVRLNNQAEAPVVEAAPIQPRAPQLFDFVAFNGETDWLEIRMRELAPIVNTFVITEATVTYAGDPRSRPLPLEFILQSCEGEQFAYICSMRSRIVHIVVDDIKTRELWEIERAQRDAFMRAFELFSDYKGDDLALFGDIDELPRRSVLEQYLSGAKHELMVRPRSARVLKSLKSMPPTTHEIVVFELAFFNYNFKWRFENDQACSMLISLRGLTQVKSVSEIWRRSTIRETYHRQAGWHCSNCFGPSVAAAVRELKRKIETTSHQEFNRAPFNQEDYIRLRLEGGLELFGRGQFQHEGGLLRPFTWNLNNETVPVSVMTHPRFAYLLGKYAPDE